MNRSLTNVLFGGIAPIAQNAGQEIKGQIVKTSVEETVEALAGAESVIIVRPPASVADLAQRVMGACPTDIQYRSSDTVWP